MVSPACYPARGLDRRRSRDREPPRGTPACYWINGYGPAGFRPLGGAALDSAQLPLDAALAELLLTALDVLEPSAEGHEGRDLLQRGAA
jgi:hypothetical protein